VSEELHSCSNCRHLWKEIESWELSHIWGWKCEAKPNMSNLKSFPFKRTKCKSFEQREISDFPDMKALMLLCKSDEQTK
jgi:hypothetical protein